MTDADHESPVTARPRGRARTWWQSLGSPKVRGALLIVVVVGGTARVAWVAYAGAQPPFTSDPSAYLLQGETIARGDGYSNPLVDIQNAVRIRNGLEPLPRQPASFYPPGYPVFVAAVTWVVWHTPIPDHDLVHAIEYVQAALGTLTILLAFLLARRVFDARAGLFTAMIVAAYPNLIATTATLQFETVFITLVLATVLVLLGTTTGRDRGRVRLVGSGVMIGAVALIHPTICFLIFAFLAARLVMRRPWRETRRDLAIVVAAMVLVILPWTIRNVVRLHAIVPFATGAGPALCMSRNAEATGSIDLAILDRQCAPKHLSPSPPKREVQVNRYSTNHAIRWIIDHPFDELKMWWTRTRLAYRHDTSGLYAPDLSRGARRTASTISDVASFVVLALAFLGAIVALAKRRPPAAVFFIVATSAFAAIPIVLFGDPRYRVPAEPLFAVLAAAAVGAGFDLIAPARQRTTTTTPDSSAH